MTAAHDQAESHKYTVHFPEHEPRESDPHYHLFNAYKARHKAKATCFVGDRIGYEFCTEGLELHHAHLEFSVQNEALWQAVAKDFPEVHDEESLATWVETEANFRWLCPKHHRSVGAGAHSVSHSDFEAGLYAPGFLN